LSISICVGEVATAVGGAFFRLSCCRKPVSDEPVSVENETKRRRRKKERGERERERERDLTFFGKKKK
jgi:hypothetical protein